MLVTAPLLSQMEKSGLLVVSHKVMGVQDWSFFHKRKGIKLDI